MNLINTLKSLKFIFKPNFWVMNYDYNEDYDIILNELLDNNNFEKINRYTAILGCNEIWIVNYPYGCFTINNLKCRASRLTIEKAYKKLIKESIKNSIK